MKRSRLQQTQQHQQQQQRIRKEKKIYSVERGLKSVETQKQYKWQLDTFLKWVGIKYSLITPEKLLELDGRELESLIIEYLDEYMHKQKGLKHATINTAMAAIVHFCTINDVWLNTKKISRFIPSDENHIADKIYTREQIAELLKGSDKRTRVVILLLVSGMRIGAIPVIQIGDLTIPKPIEDQNDQQQQKVYKIMVYHRSKRDKYYTFVTPECAKAIDDYLEFRKDKTGEDITKETSPLIREQFDLNSNSSGRQQLRRAAIPRRVHVGSVEKIVERAIVKSGIKTTHKVMLTHGFRKFAITMMKKARVDFSDREYLVGHKHSRGLDVNYDRTSEDDRLVEWSKAINNLTIDPAFHMKKKLELIEGETNQKIAMQEQEIARLKAKEHEDSKTLGELSKEFNEMKQLFVHLSKDSKKQLLDEFKEKVEDKADIEWSCD